MYKYWLPLFDNLYINCIRNRLFITDSWFFADYSTLIKNVKSTPSNNKPFNTTLPKFTPQAFLSRNFRINDETPMFRQSSFLGSHVASLDTTNFVNFYLTTAVTLSEFSYKNNAFYRNSFIAEISKSLPPFVDIKRFILTWRVAHKFLFNLFLSQAKVWAFASKVLMFEVQSFNWSLATFDYEFFKFINPHLTVKNTPYGDFRPDFATTLTSQGLFNALVVDISYHKWSISFLHKMHMFVIGLTPFNVSPWIVHYSIPCGNNGLMIQYLFVNLVIYIRRQADYFYFKQSCDSVKLLTTV